MVIETQQKVESVVASAEIKDGVLVSGNCEELSQQDPEIQYTMQFDASTSKYMCRPNQEYITVQKETSLDLGFALTVENLRSDLVKRSDEFLASVRPDLQKVVLTPQCSIDTSGAVDLSSCSCSGQMYAFDSHSKTCALRNDVVVIYTTDCSEQRRDVTQILQAFGRDLSQNSVEFDMCSDLHRAEYEMASSLLAYKILYFAYLKEEIQQQLNLGNGDVAKLMITQQEITDFMNSSSESQDSVERELSSVRDFVAIEKK